MKRSTFAKLLLIAGLAACGKPSDIGRMQDEADGFARHTLPEVTELRSRLAPTKAFIEAPNNANLPEHQQASQVANRAETMLKTLEAELQKAPAEHAAAAAKGQDELQKISDKLREEAVEQITVARGLIQTAESYVAHTEHLAINESGTTPPTPTPTEPAIEPATPPAP